MISYSAIQLYDMGYGSRMVPVTPPDCRIAPTSKIRAKDRGKAPGELTLSGWSGVDVNNPKFRCHDYATAKLWDEGWGANVGFVVGDGCVCIDNDQGREFSDVINKLLTNPLRRFVADPKHQRDAFLLHVCDFIGDPAPVSNRELKFKKGMLTATVSILARGKQFVIAGTHPGTRSPYVWNELPEFDRIPAISLEGFDECVIKLIEALGELGWSLPRGAQTPPPVSAPSATIGGTSSSTSSGHGPTLFDEARALLAQIPNRDVAPNITHSNIDDWLDDYVNWISVAYALIAFLGRLAHTPEAMAIWCDWSDGRSQTQSSESVWRSALGQTTRYGTDGLVRLVHGLIGVKPDFPDLDPEDPMVKIEETPVWDELRERWAFCKAQGFVDMITGRVCSKQAFADGHAWLAPKLRLELHVSKRARPTVADMFLSQKNRTEVFDVTYAPGDPKLTPSRDPALPSFNRWRATTIIPALIAVDQIQKWLDHLTFVLGSSQERDRFLRWCAFVAQHPGLKPNWCFLIISDAGLGKDTMVMPVKIAVGADNHFDILSYALSDSFNPWAEHKLIIVGEIAQSKTTNNSPTEVNNRLKPLLAAPPDTLTINQKNQKPHEIPNRCAAILFSNSPNPLHLERFSRRVHVVNRLGELARDQDYYDDIHKWLNDGGAELCASYLLAYSLSDAEKSEFTGVAPDTGDKTELESQNVPPQQAALEDLIDDAREGVRDGTPFNLVATAEELGALIKSKNHSHYAPSSRQVSHWLMELEKRKTGVRRLRVDPKKPLQCGVVATNQHSGRLWLLADTTADGRAWSALTSAEIIAIWKNLVAPRSATVTPFPSAKAKDYPDDDEGEERV